MGSFCSLPPCYIAHSDEIRLVITRTAMWHSGAIRLVLHAPTNISRIQTTGTSRTVSYLEFLNCKTKQPRLGANGFHTRTAHLLFLIGAIASQASPNSKPPGHKPVLRPSRCRTRCRVVNSNMTADFHPDSYTPVSVLSQVQRPRVRHRIPANDHRCLDWIRRSTSSTYK